MRLPARSRLPVASMVMVLLFLGRAAESASTSVEQALGLSPVQAGIDFDSPSADQVSNCRISAQKIGDSVGWVVTDPGGVVLRQFLDTNGDNVVDQWSYHKNGLEVYRDVDADFNGKADQYRWFHTGGARWATDKDEDGVIDAWKTIAAEEVSAEVVAALATRDARRFARLVLTDSELKSLGVGREKEKELREKLAGLPAKFNDLAARQKMVGRTTEWVQFSGNRPGVVPAGTDGSTKDVRVYENVVAIVQTGERHGQLHIGTLVHVGDVWRVIDVPLPISEDQDQMASTGFFFRSPLDNPAPATPTGPSGEVQDLLAKLETLDQASEKATSLKDRAQYNARRADLLEQIANESATAEDRAMWVRQMADMVSAAVQSGEYPDGVRRLTVLFEKLEKSPREKELAAYVQFRLLMAAYGQNVQTASNEEFVKIHSDWLKQLEEYVASYPTSPDAAEAMLQLGIAQEYSGEEEEAKKWYTRVAEQFPTSAAAKKANGARTRLDSVGKSISLRGRSPSGGSVDLASYRGKVVLVQYWASWCEPCKADMHVLRDLLGKYGRSGFQIIGVNLDTSQQDMTAFLSEERVPWPQLYEEGGLDSRLANEMGILTLPTMILIDREGAVVNRNVHVVELDRELKNQIR